MNEVKFDKCLMSPIAGCNEEYRIRDRVSAFQDHLEKGTCPCVTHALKFYMHNKHQVEICPEYPTRDMETCACTSDFENFTRRLCMLIRTRQF